MAVLALLASAAALGADKRHDPNALWRIVSTRCNPQVLQRAPDCVAVWSESARRAAVLKDRHGHYQYLLLPLQRVSGIEDPFLLRAGTPNYFALAWQARGFVEHALGRPLPRQYMSLALNSPHGRSQEQLHIHLDCLRAEVAATLVRQASAIGERFAPLSEPLRGHVYLARYLPGRTLYADPVRLLAQTLPPKAALSQYSLVVAGVEDARGPGFVLLATRQDAMTGNRASGEELQDHACGAVTGGTPLDGVM